jgi:hypothetical protein
MTWLKKSDDYADHCEDLSDAAYRTLDEALLYVMRRETGPRFPKHKLRKFATSRGRKRAAAELVTGGFWLDHGDDYEVLYHMEHQPEHELLAKKRSNASERTRQWRRRQAEMEDTP